MLIKEELPLTPEDTKTLQKRMAPIFIFPLFLGGMMYFIFGSVLGNGSFEGDSIFIFGFGAFGLIFLGIIGYMLWSYVSDIRGGVKERLEGVVTDKRLDIQTSGGHGTGSNRRKTRTTRHHYIYLEGEELKLDYRDYNRVKTGERIVMERAPKTGTVFTLEVLQSAMADEHTEGAKGNDQFLDTDMVEERFRPEDLAALKRIFIKERNRKFIFMLPLLLIASWFVYVGYWGLLVFLFPIPLILLFQFIGLCRLFLRYSKDRAHGHKRGFTTLLEDKITVTGNRHKGKHTIRTTRGRFTVSTEIYDSLSAGDRLVLYMPRNGKTPLSIVTLEGKEFYLA